MNARPHELKDAIDHTKALIIWKIMDLIREDKTQEEIEEVLKKEILKAHKNFIGGEDEDSSALFTLFRYVYIVLICSSGANNRESVKKNLQKIEDFLIYEL